MLVEHSAGAIIFRKEPAFAKASAGKGNKIFYLLLHYPSSAKAKKDYWDLPKGHIEEGEKGIDAAKRETEEETGLKDIKFVEGFKEQIKYFFKFEGQTIFKTVSFFLAQTKKKEIEISHEHIGFEWLEFEDAREKLTFKNAKDIIKKANDFIKEKSI